ncbi:MAG: PIN domain-containing protein [Planctomycetes bacterium]|nr:PIN domain-containing protein [Planctomycetota bacterium]
MVLVDTSVWVEHLRRGNAELGDLLEGGRVLTHPFVLGDLACGRMRDRPGILSLLRALPAAPVAEHEEVLSLVERHRLHGTGLGWIDAHLLASSLLSGSRLWTFDGALRAAARRLGAEAHEG